MEKEKLFRREDFVNKLVPIKEFFSDSFRKTIDETKNLFEMKSEFTDSFLVKCCVVGNTSTGKSTLINALLKKDILYEGRDVATLCAASCQGSLNKEEYFQIFDGDNCLEQLLPIKHVKDINHTNENYSKYAMSTNNHLCIYLDNSNYEILQKFKLIDSPGFDNKNFDAVSKYCKYADIIVFCFKAREGITDKDIEKIEKIKEKIGKFQICFVINRCDECDSIDRDGIIKRLYPHLTGEIAIFFISGLEEKKGMLNDERHREFERFKECLEKQKSQAKVAYRKVYLDLISSVRNLCKVLNFGSNRDYIFTDDMFMKLQEQIVRILNDNKTKYFKEDASIAFLEYSNTANKEISKFMVKQFIIDHKLNDGIIYDKYFFKRFIQNDLIPKPIFSQHEWGDKNQKLKNYFIDYFTENSTTIKKNIEQFYKERAKECMEELEIYKNDLHDITKKINELCVE